MKTENGPWKVTSEICPKDGNLFVSVQCETEDGSVCGRSFELKLKNGEMVIMDWDRIDEGFTDEKSELHLK